MIFNGADKSAILLMLLNSKEAIKIFKYFNKYEIKKIISSIININLVSQSDINTIFNEFILQYENISKYVLLDNNSYLNKIKSKILYNKNLDNFLNKISKKKIFLKKIKKLKHISDKNLYSLLKNEHSHVITSILFFLDSKTASNVISFFENQQQSKIIYLISKFSQLKEYEFSILIDIIDIILIKYKRISYNKKSLITAIDILNTNNFNNNHNIIDNIYKHDNKIGKKIFYKIFSFEDIVKLTDESIIFLIKNIDEYKILISLYHAKKSIKYKFFKHCPKLKDNIIILESDKDRYISYDNVINAKNFIVSKIRVLLKKKEISMMNLS
ncbi:FliG C-terminal domain-containing protein [Buchnera aphidicola]|uniref:Flagellar motor switch protein FliG n=1 Tax=Buchnera aphidicola (Therioaphis trifolii) TaxID=1241884 RepID=A0A4D6YK64_9GAMM|nr:FliG C-terminal domain-containing protein [Buchnera aphidicola]QCI27061.1 hypothetical protein D9V81_00285 [Buchnera aphidicola (Therioaphis trifolii)]